MGERLSKKEKGVTYMDNSVVIMAEGGDIRGIKGNEKYNKNRS